MPIPLPPTLLRCSQCGWSEPVLSRGDVIFSSPHKHCPKCGFEHIERLQRPASLLETAKTWLSGRRTQRPW